MKEKGLCNQVDPVGAKKDEFKMLLTASQHIVVFDYFLIRFMLKEERESYGKKKTVNGAGTDSEEEYRYNFRFF